MERNVSLDILKLAMAFMVVGLHARFLGEFSALAEFLTGNGLFRIAVPVFLTINGFFFYPVLSAGRQWRWLWRVVVLYAVWMAIYSYYWFYVPAPYLANLWHFFFYEIVLGYYHLWYLSGMLGATLLLMLLRPLGTGVLVFIAGLTFILGVLIQYAGNYHVFAGSYLDKLFNHHWVHRNFLLFCFPFFCVGFLIRRYRLHEKVSSVQAMVFSGIGLVLLLLESWLNFYHPARDGGFDNLWSLIVVCPALFVLFIRQEIRGSSKHIASYATGVYLVHLFFLMQFRQHTDFSFTVITVLTILLSLLVSALLIRINQRVKVLL